MEHYGYIYLTENLINHKRYIGQHTRSCFDESYLGSGKIIRRAIDKYGKENFSCEVLEWCDSEEELNAREKYWISYYDADFDDSFYNISSGGHVPVLRGKNSPRYGVSPSRESVEKQRKSLKKYYESHDVWNKGVPMREESKKKLSDKARDRYYSDESLRNTILSNLSSPESKRKSAESLREYYKTHDAPSCIPVVRLEDGKVFKSVKDAEKSISSGRVTDALRSESLYAGGYHWLLKEDYDRLFNEDIQEIINKKMYRRSDYRVIRLEDGKIYNSQQEAEEDITEGSIFFAVKDERHFAGGYHFMYLSDYESTSKDVIDELLKYNPKSTKPKRLIDTRDGLSYRSVNQYSKINGISYGKTKSMIDSGILCYE